MQSNGYCAPDASFLYPAPFFGHSYNEHMQAFPPADHRTWGMQNYDGYNAFPQADQRTWGIGDYNEYNAFPQADQRTWGIGEYRVPIHSNAQNCNNVFPVEGAFGPPDVSPYKRQRIDTRVHPISSSEHPVGAKTRNHNDIAKAARDYRFTMRKLKQKSRRKIASASTSSTGGPKKVRTRQKIQHSTSPIKMDVNPNKRLALLVEKELKNSDVGPLGRIVLPKNQAEERLPFLSEKDGVIFDMMDFATSNIWRLRYRYWPNNKSRMYILENTKEFVKLHGLEVGDFMTIYEDENHQKVIKATKVEKKECRQHANAIVPAAVIDDTDAMQKNDEGTVAVMTVPVNEDNATYEDNVIDNSTEAIALMDITALDAAPWPDDEIFNGSPTVGIDDIDSDVFSMMGIDEEERIGNVDADESFKTLPMMGIADEEEERIGDADANESSKALPMMGIADEEEERIGDADADESSKALPMMAVADDEEERAWEVDADETCKALSMMAVAHDEEAIGAWYDDPEAFEGLYVDFNFEGSYMDINFEDL